MTRPGSKTILTIILSLNSTLMALFGVGFFSTLDQIRLIWGLPERVEAVEKETEYHHKVNELNFHFARNMTDDDDKNIYAISWGEGRNDQVHEVDVRNNNEGVEFGFTYDLWTIYPIRYDTADSTRKELDFKNPETGKEKYIPLKQQR